MSDPESHRRLLFHIAYRMLGGVAEAEDMVQETLLRWHRSDVTAIREPQAWLTTTITRLCIDQLRLARRRREEYVGVWLPEPLVEETAGEPWDAGALSDSLGIAFMLMLEELAPHERAVFLLREAFGHDYDTIAAIVGKSAANCRQIVSRAKARFGRAPEPTPTEEAERLVREFVQATQTGDLADLLALLTDNAVLYSDGGGKVRAALLPILGPDRIARMFIGLRRFRSAEPPRFVRINGAPGVLLRGADRTLSAMTFALGGRKVRAVFVIRNPDKLAAAARTAGGIPPG
jgi:RNA polymerase sigma-70 factor, ECF subfamily